MSKEQKQLKKSKSRVIHTEEFRINAARLVLDENLSREQVAQDLGCHYKSVCGWVKAEKRRRSEAGTTKYSSESDEVKQLREELRVTRLERDILKKATAFFAKELIK